MARAREGAVPDQGSRKASGAAKGKKSGRGRNFTAQEDICLALAVAEVTNDPVHGRDQQSDDYWTKIWGQYNKHAALPKDIKPDHEMYRSPVALKSRFQMLQTHVNAFINCYVETKKALEMQSGANLDNLLNEALQTYKEKENDGKDFKFLEVWKILKDVDRFKQPCTNSEGVTVNCGDTGGDTKRGSEGNKAAKAAAEAQAIQREQLAQTNRLVKLSQQRTETGNNLLLLASLKRRPNPELEAEVLDLIQQQGLKRLRENAGK